MAITLPYSTDNVQYGNETFTTSYQASTSVLYCYDQMTSQGYSTINSLTKQGDGSYIANITIYSYSDISRSGTYNLGIGSYTTTPYIRLDNVTLGQNVLVYNSSLTTSVDFGFTGSITHSQTVDVAIPAIWMASANLTWVFYTQQTVTVTSTSATNTHIKSETSFIMPSQYLVWVRYNDVATTAKGIWVRKNGQLVEVSSINVNINGVIR